MGKLDKPTRSFRHLSSLSALSNPSNVDKSVVPVQVIHLPKSQPRRYFDPSKQEQLIASVKKHGIIEPLLVRPLQDEKYELVAGERRYRAALKLGMETVPIVIRELNDNEALQLALVENLQREDLNPVDETEGILQLLALQLEIPSNKVTSLLYNIQNQQKGKTTRNVAGSSEMEIIGSAFEAIGKTLETFVRHRLPLLKLPSEILEALRQGKLAYTKAQAIARLKNEEARQTLLNETIEENLSLSQIKERAKDLTPSKVEEEKEPSPQQKCKTVIQKVSKSKVWSDPKKRKQIEKLLTELERLVE